MARNVLEVVLQGVDKLSGPVRKAGESVKDFEKRAKTSSDRLKQLGKVALGVTATLAALGVTAKVAFDLGKQGAAIKQTGESFGFLMRKVGASTSLLDQLRSASKGTISDMDLMSSTATLLAGAQGDLAQELAGATPKLLEIAKAAQTLNPALGDTTFLYNSLATGVKRASPMILDNLGLTIRIGAANSAYAEALGKTVEQLTADEQKQALLNETLRAGSVLIAQAGGVTDSATDSYNQLTTAWENLTDQGKMVVHDAIEPMVAATAELLIQSNEHAALMPFIAEAYEHLADGAGRLAREHLAMAESMSRTGQAAGSLGIKASELGKSFQEVAAMVAAAGGATSTATGQIENHTRVVKDGSGAAHRLSQAETELSVAMGGTSQEILNQEGRLRLLTQELRDEATATTRSKDETAALILRIVEANRKLDEYKDALKTTKDATEGATIATVSFKEQLNAITDSADRAMIGIGNLLPVVVDVGAAELSAATVASEWAKMNDLAALAAGELTQEIIDEQAELARLTIQVESARFVDDKLREAWIASKNRLTELTDGLTGNTGTLIDNTAAKEANRLATERANEITDLYRIMTGGATADTIALEKQIRAATEAFEEQGDASGFTADEIAKLRFTLLEMNDILREQRRVTTSSISALDHMTQAAKRSWLELSKLGTVMPGMPGGAPPGEYEGPGGAERFAEEQGWQVSAAGRDQEKHAKEVLGQIAAQHSGVWESGGDMSGWVKEFMMSGAGTGLAAGFDESVIDAAIKDQEYAHAQGAHGLSGVVPGGFPNDSFLIGATSGEHVQVTPAGRGNGGGMVINNLYLTGVQTDSQLFDAVTRVARQRGRAFAKVM